MPPKDARYEYCSDGSIYRVRPKPIFNPLRCTAKPHGLGDQPSSWKAANDCDRQAMNVRVDGLRYAHVMARAAFWSNQPMPSNDNQSWPLLKALRQDGNEALVSVAERYRRTADAASTQPIGTANPNDLFVVPKYGKAEDPDNRTRGILETTHSAGDSSGGKAQRETGRIADARQKSDTRNPVRRSINPIRVDHTEDITVGVIDARRDMARLRRALGPLVGPFEEAVLDGETLADIGAARGIGQHAGGAGKLVVMMGLEVVQSEFARMDRERRLRRI